MLKIQEILEKHKKTDLAVIHHNLMKFYGCWIPIEEFRKIPIPTLVNLISYINEDLKKQLKTPKVPKIRR